MKNYFKKRLFLCTKKLKMDSGDVVFKKNKVYAFDVDNSPTTFSLIDENKTSHEVSVGNWGKHFIEIKPKHAKKS